MHKKIKENNKAMGKGTIWFQVLVGSQYDMVFLVVKTAEFLLQSEPLRFSSTQAGKRLHMSATPTPPVKRCRVPMQHELLRFFQESTDIFERRLKKILRQLHED